MIKGIFKIGVLAGIGYLVWKYAIPMLTGSNKD